MNQTAELHLTYSIQFWVLDIKTSPAHCRRARGPAARGGAGNHPNETQENTQRSSNRRVFREGQEKFVLYYAPESRSNKQVHFSSIWKRTRSSSYGMGSVWGHNLSGTTRKEFLAVWMADQRLTAWVCYGITGRIVKKPQISVNGEGPRNQQLYWDIICYRKITWRV